MDAASLKINAKLDTSLSEIDRIISQFKKVMYAKTKDSVSAAYIEKLDVNGEPKEFFIMSFTKDGMEIEYTIPENVPPSIRKWTVVRKSLPIISSVAKNYNIDNQGLLNLIETTLSETISLIPKDSKMLYVENDKLKSKINELEIKLRTYVKDKEELSTKLYESTTRVNECMAKLQKYEEYSDELIKSKIIAWVKEHDGTIDIPEFAKLFNVPESKVEALLRELVDDNYIKPVG